MIRSIFSTAICSTALVSTFLCAQLTFLLPLNPPEEAVGITEPSFGEVYTFDTEVRLISTLKPKQWNKLVHCRKEDGTPQTVTLLAENNGITVRIRDMNGVILHTHELNPDVGFTTQFAFDEMLDAYSDTGGSLVTRIYH